MLLVVLVSAGCVAPHEASASSTADSTTSEDLSRLLVPLEAGTRSLIISVDSSAASERWFVLSVEPGDDEAFLALTVFEEEAGELDWALSVFTTARQGGQLNITGGASRLVLAIAVTLSRPNILDLRLSDPQGVAEAVSTGSAQLSVYHAWTTLDATPRTNEIELNVEHSESGIGMPGSGPAGAGTVSLRAEHPTGGRNLSISSLVDLPVVTAGLVRAEWDRFGEPFLYEAPRVTPNAVVELSVGVGVGSTSMRFERTSVSSLPRLYFDHVTLDWPETLPWQVAPIDPGGDFPSVHTVDLPSLEPVLRAALCPRRGRRRPRRAAVLEPVA